MGSDELIANLFRISQTNQKIRNDNIKGEDNANITHYQIGKNIREVIKEILDSYKISKTNGIYVCTKAYYFDPHVVYQDLVCTTVDVDIDSKCAERRIYYDIESGALERAFKEENNFYPTFHDFEDFNIVLNPYNTSKDKNGYEEVRMDFFENAIKYGQAKSKKLLLSKYKKL
jgi:hypothetical protein